MERGHHIKPQGDKNERGQISKRGSGAGNWNLMMSQENTKLKQTDPVKSKSRIVTLWGQGTCKWAYPTNALTFQRGQNSLLPRESLHPAKFVAEMRMTVMHFAQFKMCWNYYFFVSSSWFIPQDFRLVDSRQQYFPHWATPVFFVFFLHGDRWRGQLENNAEGHAAKMSQNVPSSIDIDLAWAQVRRPHIGPLI